jgi:hypothetical protein
MPLELLHDAALIDLCSFPRSHVMGGKELQVCRVGRVSVGRVASIALLVGYVQDPLAATHLLY